VTLAAGATLIVLALVLLRAIGRQADGTSLVDSVSRRTRRAVRTVGAITLSLIALSCFLFVDAYGGAIGRALLLVTAVADIGFFVLAMPFGRSARAATNERAPVGA
jgi:hypothetical protein